MIVLDSQYAGFKFADDFPGYPGAPLTATIDTPTAVPGPGPTWPADLGWSENPACGQEQGLAAPSYMPWIIAGAVVLGLYLLLQDSE